MSIQRRAVAFLAASLATSLGACAPAEQTDVLLDADPEADGAPGERGAFGAKVTRRMLSPATEGAVEADVFEPFVDDVDADESPCPCMPFILVQGGAVPVERYRWMGAHLASRGLVVAAPTHPFDLSFFAIDHAERALKGLRAATQDGSDALFGRVDARPAVVAGHSLGGVVAAKNWAATSASEIRHLVLLASFPQEGDRFGDRAGRVLSIVGGRDERSSLDEVRAGAEAFPDAQVIVVDGMNHYQWTDDATDSELETDGKPTEKTDVVRARALSFIDALVDDVRELAFYPFDDVDAWPEGTRAP